MRLSIVLLPIILTLFSESLGFDLKCADLTYTDIDMFPCLAYDLVITNPDDTITSVNGNTEPWYQYDILKIQNQEVNFVPKNIAEFFPQLIELEISNSSLEWIEQDNFNELTNLRTLNLENNRLEILEAGVFDYNTYLHTINIRGNLLSFVHSEVFYKLTNLQKINLSRNGCTQNLDDDYFNNANRYRYDVRNQLNSYCQSSSENVLNIHKRHFKKRLEVLQSELRHQLKTCDSNLDAALANFRQQKLINSNTMEPMDRPNGSLAINMDCAEDVCTIIDIKVSFANMTIESEHFTNTDITSLHIHQQPTLFLPKNLAERFPRLNRLSVIECGLYEIDYRVFEGLGLFTLNLTKNKIPEVPLDTFADLVGLLELDLSSNKIHALQNDVFASLKNLQKLYLNNNFLSVISVEVIKNLASLKELLLQDNQLKFIGATLLTPLTSLESVDLSGNVCINMSYPATSLIGIETTIIDKCIAPVALNCKSDRNETIENNLSGDNYCHVGGLFIEYPKTKISKLIGSGGVVGLGLNNSVKVFFAKNQSMKFFPYQLSQQLPNLQRIEVQQSKLTALHRMDFDGFSKLTEIVINQNNLSSIIPGSFDTVPQLELLDLSSNNIVALPTKIFVKLAHIHTLLLSNNRIVRFSANVMPRKNLIDVFRVDANQLEFFETKTIRLLRKAKVIDLTGNICIDMKFAKTENSTRALVELSGEIDLNCSVDDFDYD